MADEYTFFLRCHDPNHKSDERQQSFLGPNVEACKWRAYKAGWRLDGELTCCPECANRRAKRRLARKRAR